MVVPKADCWAVWTAATSAEQMVDRKAVRLVDKTVEQTVASMAELSAASSVADLVAQKAVPWAD
jgi:hypothetical protein